MAIITSILNALLILTSLFLICLVLIQRGKGGGLAGAFGGMGGSSAFGTKAGDVFTRVTMWVFLFWALLAMVLVYQSNRGTESAWGNDPATSLNRGLDTKSGSGKDKSKAKPGDKASSGTSTAPTSPATSPSSPVSAPALPDDSPPAKSK